MNIPKVVKNEAQRNGLRALKLIGKLDSRVIFAEAPLLDDEGNPMPTGLPRLIIYSDNKVEFVEGEEALNILSRTEERKAIEAGYCSETIGMGPNGGCRTLCYFYDSEGAPCEESEAATMQILEFDAENICIFSLITESTNS